MKGRSSGSERGSEVDRGEGGVVGRRESGGVGSLMRGDLGRLRLQHRRGRGGMLHRRRGQDRDVDDGRRRWSCCLGIVLVDVVLVVLAVATFLKRSLRRRTGDGRHES
jgi:hypothetical protein